MLASPGCEPHVRFGSANVPPSSSGLGHRPFKATAGIRIPLGALPMLGVWAHSSVGEHLPYKQGVAGSNPAAPTCLEIEDVR